MSASISPSVWTTGKEAWFIMRDATAWVGSWESCRMGRLRMRVSGSVTGMEFWYGGGLVAVGEGRISCQ